MALLFVDSFDHYTTVAQISNKWAILQRASGATTDIQVGEGRFGTNALRINDWAAGTGRFRAGPHVVIADAQTVVCGFAFRLDGNPASGPYALLQIWDISTLQCYLNLNTDLTLSFVRGDDTVLGTTTATLTAGTYAYIEVKVTVAVSGSYEVHVDETPVLTGTGVDTDESGNELTNRIQLGGKGPNNNDGIFDDFYLCDTTGDYNKDFLGDTHIEARFPDNPGEFEEWGLVDAALTNTFNYESVDETTPDEESTYNVGSALLQRDTFFFGSPSLDVPIHAVVLQARLRKESAGERNLSLLAYSGGSVTPGGTHYFGSEYRYFRQIYPTESTSGTIWTQAAVGTAQFGYEIIPAP
jgi:hypothetical protein